MKNSVPDQRQLKAQMDTELDSLHHAIRDYLSTSEYKFALGVNIASTKGLLLSFLGISAHVFAKNGTCIRTFGLEMLVLKQRHTGPYIHSVYLDALKRLGLKEQKIMRVVTDCGSNMLSAFL